MLRALLTEKWDAAERLGAFARRSRCCDEHALCTATEVGRNFFPVAVVCHRDEDAAPGQHFLPCARFNLGLKVHGRQRQQLLKDLTTAATTKTSGNGKKKRDRNFTTLRSMRRWYRMNGSLFLSFALRG